MPRALQETSPVAIRDIDRCNLFLRPLRAAGKTLVCTLRWIIGKDHGCGKKWVHDLEEVFHGGLKEYMKEFVRAHLTSAEVSLDVVKEIDLRFQLEIAGTVGVSFWFDVDFMGQKFFVGPCPDALICDEPLDPVSPSFGWFLSLSGGSPTGTSLSGLPNGEVTGDYETIKDQNGKDVLGDDGKPKIMKDVYNKPIPKKDKDGNPKPPKYGTLGSKITPARDKNKNGAIDAAKDEPGGQKFESPSKNGLPVPSLDVWPLRVSLSVALQASINA